MQTRFLTSLRTTFNPFSRASKVPRLFLALLPPNARQTLKISVTQLPRASTEPSVLELGFKDGKEMRFVLGGQKQGGMAANGGNAALGETAGGIAVDEGKELKLKDVMEEVERHCRILGRKEELMG